MASVCNTERTYYRDTYLNRLDVTILKKGKDENGNFIECDKTIFHPQGGGQPDDTGYFEKNGNKFPVTKLSAPRDPTASPYVVKHYYKAEREEADSLLEEQSIITQIIDVQKRTEFARWHSAGHLLSNAVNKLYPQLDGHQGNHFAGQAFVKFRGPIPDLTDAKDKIEKEINNLIQQNLPLKNEWKTSPRTIQFGELKGYPCGGTHVNNTSEIGQVTVRYAKKEKNEVKVAYEIKI